MSRVVPLRHHGTTTLRQAIQDPHQRYKKIGALSTAMTSVVLVGTVHIRQHGMRHNAHEIGGLPCLCGKWTVLAVPPLSALC